MTAFGTKLPIRHVRSLIATGGKPDMARAAQFGRDCPHGGLGPHDGADGSRSHAARAFGSFAGHVDSPQHPTISFGRNRMSHPAIMAEGRVCAI